MFNVFPPLTDGGRDRDERRRGRRGGRREEGEGAEAEAVHPPFGKVTERHFKGITSSELSLQRK